MKRGLVATILISLLYLPSVMAKDSILDIAFGTTEEVSIFLKIMYTSLVFVVIFWGLKTRVFKEKDELKFAKIVALIFAILTMRFTPESVIVSFAWLLVVIAPWIIFYTVLGFFFKDKEGGGINWWRALLATLLTGILFVTIASYSGFSDSIGAVPGVGPALDEFLQDARNLVFSELDWFWAMLIVGVILYLVISLGSRVFGGSGASSGGAGNWGSFLRGFLIVFLVLFLLSLFGWGLEGGLGGIFAWLANPLAGIARIIGWGLGILALVALLGFLAWLLYRFPQLRSALWWLIRAPFRLLWLLFRGLWFLIGGAGRLIRNGGRAVAGAARGNNVWVTLIVQARTVTTAAGPRNEPTQNIRMNTTPREVRVNPGSPTQLGFRVSRGRFRLTAGALENATLNFALVGNGALNSPAITTGPGGRANVTFNAPPTQGDRAILQVIFAHPEVTGAVTIPDYILEVGLAGPAPTPTLRPFAAAIYPGDTVNFYVDINDGAGNGINCPAVTINFGAGTGLTDPAAGPSIGGTAGTDSSYHASITAPAAGTYNFTITVTPPPGSAAPAVIPGAFTVMNPTLATMQFNPPIILPLTVNRGGHVNIDMQVHDAATGAAIPIPAGGTGPAIVITPPGGLAGLVHGAGNLNGTGDFHDRFVTTAATPTMAHTFAIAVTHPGYNTLTTNLVITVNPAPTLTFTIARPAGPYRVSQPIPFTISVNAVGAAVDANVEIQLGGLTLATQRTGAGGTVGELVFPFTPTQPAPPSTAAVAHTFRILVTEPAYTDAAPQTFTINVLPMGVIRMWTELVPTTPLLMTNTATVTIHTQDQGTSIPLAGPLMVTSSTGSPLTAFTPAITATTGTVTATFTPPSVGTHTYEMNMGLAGYLPRAPVAVTIQVDPIPGLQCTVNWMPEQSTSNRSMLLNVVVINDVTGVPINGAQVIFDDAWTPGADRINEHGSTHTTNASGQFPAPVTINLGGRAIAAGGTEAHTVEVRVTDGTTTIMGDITLTFHPPRSRLGGPASVTF